MRVRVYACWRVNDKNDRWKRVGERGRVKERQVNRHMLFLQYDYEQSYLYPLLIFLLANSSPFAVVIIARTGTPGGGWNANKLWLQMRLGSPLSLCQAVARQDCPAVGLNDNRLGGGGGDRFFVGWRRLLWRYVWEAICELNFWSGDEVALLVEWMVFTRAANVLVWAKTKVEQTKIQ